jgi:hypothetical protein
MLPIGYRDAENDWLVNLKSEKQGRLSNINWLIKKNKRLLF